MNQIVIQSIRLILLSGTFVFVSFHLTAQQEYWFNQPGSPCYISYLKYAPNNDYSNRMRPYVFVLGKAGSSPTSTFNQDTLKKNPDFYNFMFVYVPNSGGASSDKLNCIPALSSLVTNNYVYGKRNTFFYIYDDAIIKSDLNTTEFRSSFGNILLAGHPAALDSSGNSKSLSEEFVEIRSEIYQKPESVEEEYGTYYYAEDPDSKTTVERRPAAKKEYFGPPTVTNFTLSGIVRDNATGEALPFANIGIKGTTMGVATNADGYFTLLKVPCDTSVLIVQYVGYIPTEVYLTPFTQHQNLVVSLDRSQNNLKEVTIIGDREEILLSNKTDISMVKLTPRKLEQLPCVGERDIMRSFQLMPGISASNESSSGLYVRGGTPDQNLVLYDGFTVYHVDHLYGFFSAFNSNALKDVQLYKGGFESRFGGRLSSVTEITGKDGNQKRFNMGADLSLLSINAFVEVPVGDKFSSIVTYRRSYKGALYNLIFDKFNGGSDDSNDDNASELQNRPGGGQMQETEATSYFYDLNGKFTYRPGKKDIISLSFFNGTDYLDNSSSLSKEMFGPSGTDFRMSSTDLTNYGNIGSSLKWARKFNSKLYGTTVVSYSNYFSDRDRSQERISIDDSGDSTTTNFGVFENNDLRDYSLRSDFQYDLTTICQLQAGVFGTYYDIDYSYGENDTSNVIEKHNSDFLAGSYLQSRFRFLKEKIVFVPGIRSSWFGATHQWYQEPRATLTVSLSKKFTWRVAAGKYYQFANRVTREDIMEGSRDFWLLSDGSSIPVSSSQHLISGLSYENASWLFSTELYYKTLSNITEYSLRFNTSPMGSSYEENFYSGSGKARGVEFLLQKKSGKLNGWVSYTLGESLKKFTVYSDEYYAADQDVRHEFKVVGVYSWRRWDFAMTWIYATGRPYTSPSGAYTITLLDGSTQDFFTVTDKNILRFPDYHRADISATYKLLKGTKDDLKRREIGSIGFSFFNLYNRKNVWYKKFTIEDGEIIETNVNYLGITPNVTLSLKLW